MPHAREAHRNDEEIIRSMITAKMNGSVKRVRIYVLGSYKHYLFKQCLASKQAVIPTESL